MTSLSKLGIALLLVACAGACSSPVPTEAEGRTANHLLAGRVVGEDELATALRSAGFDEDTVPKMICTAKYESSFHEGATNKNTNGTTDYGIFQINSIHVGKTAGCPSSTSELMDVTANTACAFGVYSIQGLEAWVAYKSHRSECDAATAPAGGADPSADPNAEDPGADPNANPSAGTGTGTGESDGGTATGDPNDPNAPYDPNDPYGDGAGEDPCAYDPGAPGCQDDGWGDPGAWSIGRAARTKRLR